jgi:hypothetical protein
MLFSEHGWTVRISFSFLLLLVIVELFLRLLMLSHLLIKDIKVLKVPTFNSSLFGIHVVSDPLLPG